MSTAWILIGIPTICYALQSASSFHQKQYGLALTFACYAVANVGLLLVAEGV